MRLSESNWYDTDDRGVDNSRNHKCSYFLFLHAIDSTIAHYRALDIATTASPANLPKR